MGSTPWPPFRKSHAMMSWNLLIAVVCASAETPVPLKVSLSSRPTAGKQVFVDVHGRERIFHGTNVVVKGPPWLPYREHFDEYISLTSEDFEYMQQAGLNLIRLGVMWPGAEPLRGQFNESFFNEIRSIVLEAGRYGIYVLADMHQDVLSEKFCGEGLPSWAADESSISWLGFPVPLLWRPFERGADGFPTRQSCASLTHGWTLNYVAYSTEVAAQALVKDPMILQAWGDFWAKTVSVLKGLDNVLGFELINEPFPGNGFLNPLILDPYWGDRYRLETAYDHLNTMIRSVDEEALIFFAAVTWSNTVTGFTHPPGGQVYANRSVLAFHYYTPPQEVGKETEYFQAKSEDARRLGTGMMLTESCCGDLFDHAAPEADRLGVSWIHWEWKNWCKQGVGALPTSQWDEYGSCKTGFGGGPFYVGSAFYGGGPDWVIMRALARPYPQSLAGTFVNSSYNTSDVNSSYQLCFVVDATIVAPTVIFANAELGFGGSFKITVVPPVMEVAHLSAQHLVELTPKDSTAHGLLITLSLQADPQHHVV